jgi:hypothetical protein
MTNAPSRSTSLHSNERGIALAIALMAMIVIGALVTGTFFAARMEMASGRNAVYSGQATEAAEAGIADILDNWNSAWNTAAVDLDQIQASAYPVTGNTSVRYTQTVRRMQGGVYEVISQGDKLDRNGNLVASRLLAKMLKLVTTSIDIQAAVTSKGSPTITGNITNSGLNTTPASWTPVCTGPSVAAVRSDLAISNGGSSVLVGTPITKPNDSGVVDSLFTNPYYSLLPLTNIDFPSSNGPTLSNCNSNGVCPRLTGSPARCDKSNTSNWGEPDHTPGGTYILCSTYYPIVHFANAFGNGNIVHITGGSGQGILLVDGDIQMDGGFEFDGIVIALGNVSVQGNGTKVTGAILGQSVDAGVNTFSGTSLVSYSQCTILAALNGAAVAVALNERSWAQINPR